MAIVSLKKGFAVCFLFPIWDLLLLFLWMSLLFFSPAFPKTPQKSWIGKEKTKQKPKRPFSLDHPEMSREISQPAKSLTPFFFKSRWVGQVKPLLKYFPRRKQRWQPFCSRRLFLKRNQSRCFGINCRWRRRKSHSFGNSDVMQGRAQNHKSYKKKHKKNRQKENQKMSKSKINSHQSN